MYSKTLTLKAASNSPSTSDSDEGARSHHAKPLYRLAPEPTALPLPSLKLLRLRK